MTFAAKVEEKDLTISLQEVAATSLSMTDPLVDLENEDCISEIMNDMLSLNEEEIESLANHIVEEMGIDTESKDPENEIPPQDYNKVNGKMSAPEYGTVSNGDCNGFHLHDANDHSEKFLRRLEIPGKYRIMVQPKSQTNDNVMKSVTNNLDVSSENMKNSSSLTTSVKWEQSKSRLQHVPDRISSMRFKSVTEVFSPSIKQSNNLNDKSEGQLSPMTRPDPKANCEWNAHGIQLQARKEDNLTIAVKQNESNLDLIPKAQKPSMTKSRGKTRFKRKKRTIPWTAAGEYSPLISRNEKLVDHQALSTSNKTKPEVQLSAITLEMTRMRKEADRMPEAKWVKFFPQLRLIDYDKDEHFDHEKLKCSHVGDILLQQAFYEYEDIRGKKMEKKALRASYARNMSIV